MGNGPPANVAVDSAAKRGEPRPRGPGSRWVFRALLLAFPFVVAEAIVRVTGETGEDGRFVWRGIETWPEPLPVAEHDRLIAPLREGGAPRIVEHPQLGWTPTRSPMSSLGSIAPTRTELAADPTALATQPGPNRV